MRFLLKLLALIVGFTVVGLIGLSVVGVLTALVRPTVAPHRLLAPNPALRLMPEFDPSATVTVVRPPAVRLAPTLQGAVSQVGIGVSTLVLLPLLVVMGFVCLALLAIRLVVNRTRGPGDVSSAEDARLLQELHQGMGRFEQRIQALETILLNDAGYRTSST